MSDIKNTRLKMAAFTVIPAGSFAHNPSTEKVTLTAVRGNSDSAEDNAYAKYTPGAQLELSVDNTAVHGFFKPGRKYYVDIHECPEEAQK